MRRLPVWSSKPIGGNPSRFRRCIKLVNRPTLSSCQVSFSLLLRWEPIPCFICSAVTPISRQNERRPLRSEEQTYELQSLMRSSYAVLRLKKKTTPSNLTTNIEEHNYRDQIQQKDM